MESELYYKSRTKAVGKITPKSHQKQAQITRSSINVKFNGLIFVLISSSLSLMIGLLFVSFFHPFLDNWFVLYELAFDFLYLAGDPPGSKGFEMFPHGSDGTP